MKGHKFLAVFSGATILAGGALKLVSVSHPWHLVVSLTLGVVVAYFLVVKPTKPVSGE